MLFLRPPGFNTTETSPICATVYINLPVNPMTKVRAPAQMKINAGSSARFVSLKNII